MQPSSQRPIVLYLKQPISRKTTSVVSYATQQDRKMPAYEHILMIHTKWLPLDVIKKTSIPFGIHILTLCLYHCQSIIFFIILFNVFHKILPHVCLWLAIITTRTSFWWPMWGSLSLPLLASLHSHDHGDQLSLFSYKLQSLLENIGKCNLLPLHQTFALQCSGVKTMNPISVLRPEP